MAMTNAQKQAAFRARRDKRIRELEARLRNHAAPGNAELEARIRELEARLRNQGAGGSLKLEARIRELGKELTARDTRIAELEAVQTSRDSDHGFRALETKFDARLARRLKAAMHPDRVQHPEAKAQLAEIFRLISEALESTAQDTKAQAKRREEWSKRREEVRERNSRRAKEAHARRKAKQAAEAVKSKLVAGTFVIFKGELKDNTGNSVVAPEMIVPSFALRAGQRFDATSPLIPVPERVAA